MRLPRNNPKKARIEIVPMIDTIFFLLVFFMLSSLSMISRYSVPVNLPTATGRADQVPQVITVTITKEGNLFYNKEKIISSQGNYKAFGDYPAETRCGNGSYQCRSECQARQGSGGA